MIKIDTSNLSGAAPLFHRYPTQFNPQPAYVEMDEDGHVSADYSGEIGYAISALVWHNRTLRWPVSPYANAAALKTALDMLAPKFAALHAEHDVVWDGSNHVGKLTLAGEQIEQDIERALQDIEEDQVYDVGEWCQTEDIDALWPDGTALSAAVQSIRDATSAEGITLDGNVRERLLQEAASHDFCFVAAGTVYATLSEAERAGAPVFMYFCDAADFDPATAGPGRLID